MPSQHEFTLHFAPNTCARVPLIALHQIGCPYNLEVVAFMNGDHRSPDYLALNPKGKVPTLVIDGRPLTENVAILSWLAEEYPDANLLPETGNSFDRSLALADLAFCASTLHPIVTRLRIPQFFCDSEQGGRRVFEMASDAMRLPFSMIDERLGQSTWWYGDRWSIVDAYLNWIWFRVSGTSFDVSAFAHLARHDEAMQKLLAVANAIEVNDRAARDLAARGLAVQFSGSGAISQATWYRS